MARVLVTGGAGFIGSHLAEALVRRGDQVRIFDNFSSGRRSNLAHIANQVEIFEGDICNPSDVEAALQGCESIFHQAAMVSVPESIEQPLKCFEANVQAVIKLLDLAKHNGIKRIVLASSTAVYGANENMPLNETMVPQALSPYAASKHFNESLASVYAENYAMHVVSLRYFNVYGPRQRPDSDYAAVIPKFVERLMNNQAPIVFGDGQQSRDFIHVDDVVRANLLAAEKDEVAGMAFNVCSGVESSLLELLKLLYQEFPNAPKAQFTEARLGDVARSSGDPGLAATLLAFKARTSLEDGLQRLIRESQ